MIRKLRLLKNLDLFGVPHKTQISLSEDEQKSLIGGLITAILYGLSFAYFIYVFIQWQTGKILPGFSSMIKAQNFSSYQFKGENCFNSLIGDIHKNYLIHLILKTQFSCHQVTKLQMDSKVKLQI